MSLILQLIAYLLKIFFFLLLLKMRNKTLTLTPVKLSSRQRHSHVTTCGIWIVRSSSGHIYCNELVEENLANCYIYWLESALVGLATECEGRTDPVQSVVCGDCVAPRSLADCCQLQSPLSFAGHWPRQGLSLSLPAAPPVRALHTILDF